MSWVNTKIGEHCTVTSSKRFHLSDRSESGIPFYCSKEIIQKVKGQEITDCDYIKEEAYEEVKKRFGVPEKGDLLITTRGTYGVPYIYKESDKFYFADGNLTWLKEFDDKLSVNYLYYWILSYEGQKKIDAIAKGTAQKAVPIALIRDIELAIPPIETQRRIASILSAYDNLIENNQKQIKLLEEAAQRLYKEWFVDLHFPGWEETKIVDGLPEGWEKKQICNIADIKAGGDKPETVNKDKSEKTPIPIYANGIEKDGLYGYTTKPVIEKESVTISARGTVGFVFLRRTPYVPIVRLLSVIPDSIPAIYLYYCLKNETFERNGTSQQQITVPMVKNKNLLIADILLIDKFTSIVTEFHDKIDILKTQIELLTEVRDRLLPKLMSGELEV